MADTDERTDGRTDGRGAHMNTRKRPITFRAALDANWTGEEDAVKKRSGLCNQVRQNQRLVISGLGFVFSFQNLCKMPLTRCLKYGQGSVDTASRKPYAFSNIDKTYGFIRPNLFPQTINEWMMNDIGKPLRSWGNADNTPEGNFSVAGLPFVKAVDLGTISAVN